MVNLNYNTNLVLEIQNYLINIKDLYPSLPAVESTGVYDKVTKSAVLEFQKIKGLPTTGLIDVPTLHELVRENNEYLRRTQMPIKITFSIPDFTDVKTGDHRDIVYVIKIMLNSFCRRYINCTELEITKLYDEKTEEAVRLFQQRSMLPVTGIVDMVTWNTLGLIYDCCRFHIEMP